MKIELFLHHSGRLAVRPTLEPGETYQSLIGLLRPLPCRHWHPRERLWTLTLGAPGTRPFVHELVHRGWLEESPDPLAPAALQGSLRRPPHHRRRPPTNPLTNAGN